MLFFFENSRNKNESQISPIEKAIDIAKDKRQFQELVLSIVSRQRETQLGDI